MLPVHERIPGVTGTQTPTRVRYWVIVFAVTLAVITYIDRVSISFAAPFISKDLGLDSRHMGLAFTAFGWAYAAIRDSGRLPGRSPRTAQRAHAHRAVVELLHRRHRLGLEFRSRSAHPFLFGAGEAGCFPNLTKTFTTWLPAKERVRAQGIMWLSARWGGAFTPPLVAIVMGMVGWRHTFELFGVPGRDLGHHLLPLVSQQPAGQSEAQCGGAGTGARTASANARPHGDVPWAKFLGSRQVWMICLQYFCLSYGWYFYITWLPTYLKEARHLDVKSVAILQHRAAFPGRPRQSGQCLHRQPACAHDRQHVPDPPHHGLYRVHRRQHVSPALHPYERSADGDALLSDWPVSPTIW